MLRQMYHTSQCRSMLDDTLTSHIIQLSPGACREDQEPSVLSPGVCGPAPWPPFLPERTRPKDLSPCCLPVLFASMHAVLEIGIFGRISRDPVL